MNLSVFSAVLVFVFGFAVGSFFNQPASLQEKENLVPSSSLTESAPPTTSAAEVAIEPPAQISQMDSPMEPKCDPALAEEIQKFQRTPKHLVDDRMKTLYSQLMSAFQERNLKRQNENIAEMIALSPNHVKTYQAKTYLLVMEENFEEAKSVLQECALKLPEAVFCHQRLTNIRNSSHEERIEHGNKCLALAPTNGSCLTDLALSYKRAGNLTEAIKLFEQAIKVRELNSEGYNLSYLYWHLGSTLHMNQNLQEAFLAYEKACNLNNQQACQKLESLSDS